MAPKCMATSRFFLKHPSGKIGSFDGLTVPIVHFDEMGDVFFWSDEVLFTNSFEIKDTSRA